MRVDDGCDHLVRHGESVTVAIGVNPLYEEVEPSLYPVKLADVFGLVGEGKVVVRPPVVARYLGACDIGYDGLEISAVVSWHGGVTHSGLLLIVATLWWL